MKKIKEIILPIFLLIQPFLDILISLQSRYLPNTISIGVIIRGLLLVLVLFYIWKQKKYNGYIYSLFIFILIYIIYDIFILKSSISGELSNLFQIFYFPFLILFFSLYNNDKINKKLITIIYFILLNSIIIPYIFGLGYNISEYYINKEGYLGFYTGGNEISAILLCFLPILITYLKEYKNIFLKILFIIEYIACSILIATKVLFLGSIIIIAILIIKELINKKKINIKVLSIILLILIIGVISIPHTPIYKNYIVSTNYYNVDSIDDILKEDNIDNIIFSKRLSNAKKIDKKYDKSIIAKKLLGLGRTYILSIKDIEIDFLDIFYSIGIIGTIYYLVLLFFILKNTKLYGIYKLSFIFLIFISFFSGHILIKPQVSIYLSLLFLLNKYDKDYNKKRILLVANMYPSKKAKYYGSFVKNVYNLLNKNDYIMDKETITKHNNKIVKVFSYIKLHLFTIIKGTFNYYDYIYVHFISHSSLGAVIVKKIKPNIKLVLNPHGNDVVKDYEFEEKNINRSRKYIKYADKVVVPSKYFKEIMIKEYDLKEDKIFVYPSGGVNTKLFISKDKKEAKQEIGLDKNTNYIGYISRIEKNKGYDTYIEAINELVSKNKISNTKFIIVGRGDEKTKLNKLIKEYNLEDLIIKRDMVSQKELVNIYNSLDLFVLPTYRKSESLSLVGLEAMSCEIPVLAAENYGPTDYVINNKNGFFFKPQDSKMLAKKILDILKRKDLETIKENARLTAEEYDIDNTKNKILDLFNNFEA